VYGRTLHTIAFISGLLNRGVKPERINYVIPPRQILEPPKQLIGGDRKTFNDNDPNQQEE